MSKPNTLNFGVIGLGNIAAHHIKSIQALDNGKLIAVTSRDPDKRASAEKNLNVQAFADYEAMLQLPELDAVCICTPSGNHLEPCLAAADAGKHVITEKPLEINSARGQQMVDACRKAGVTLACIFQNRYSQGYRSLADVVAKGQLGKLVLGNAYIKWYRPPEYYTANNWRGTLKGDGGAALINQSIHTIDLLLNIMGPVKSVLAKTRTLTHAIEGEDVGVAILEFENGALGTVEGSTAIYAGFPERLEIHGDEGSVVMEAGNVVTGKGKNKIDLNPGDNRQNASGSSNPMAIDVSLHISQFKEITDAILNNREPEVNGVEALKSVRVIEAIYESSRLGKEVFFRNPQ